jgi:hypothetical protein
MHGPWSWDYVAATLRRRCAIMALDMPSQAIDYMSYRCCEVTPLPDAVQVKRNIAGGQEQGARAVT